MLEKLHNNKRMISRFILLVFMLSSFSMAAQASAHTFMMLEMQQHKAMGHDMSSHCQPVLCESIISLDNQTSHGMSVLSMIDLNTLPAVELAIQTSANLVSRQYHPRLNIDADPPPLALTGILRI